MQTQCFSCVLTGLVSVDLFQPTTVSQTNISPDTSATLGSGDTCREQDWYVNTMMVIIRAVAAPRSRPQYCVFGMEEFTVCSYNTNEIL